MSDEIVKTVVLRAPPKRVWEAIVDSAEFGRWFRVAFDAPFVEGGRIAGRITHPGYEHLTMEITVVRIEPPRRFAFTWTPYAVDPEADYSGETPTTVEFVLEPAEAGTRLTVTERGFDGVAPERRAEAFRMNDGGWAQQMENIRAHVEH